jgi:cell division protein FtsQ
MSRIWRTLKVTTIVAVLAGAGALAHSTLTAGEAFVVRDIRIRGHERLSLGEISMLLDGLQGRNVMVTALDPWRQRLLGSPWVKDAALRRVLPDAVDVTIVERQAAAIARSGRSLHLIDAEGVVIDEYGPRYAALDLPLIEGLDLGGDAPTEARRTALALAALDDLSAAGLLWRVSQVDVTRPYDAVVTLNDDSTLLRLGDARFSERLRSYLDMASRLQTMASELEYVDLRFDDRVYIRPRRAGVTFASTPADATSPVAAEVVEIDVIPDDTPSGQE